jgi:hypothetical protein
MSAYVLCHDRRNQRTSHLELWVVFRHKVFSLNQDVFLGSSIVDFGKSVPVPPPLHPGILLYIVSLLRIKAVQYANRTTLSLVFDTVIFSNCKA